MMSTDTGHHEKVRIRRPESWRQRSHPAYSPEALFEVFDGNISILSQITDGMLEELRIVENLNSKAH